MKGRWQTDTSRVIWHGAGRKTARWKWRGTEKYCYTGESLQIRLWLIPVLSEMVANRRNTANKGKYCHLVYCETNSEHSAAGFLAGKPKPSNKHEGNEVQGIGNSNLVFRANLHRRRTPKWQEKSPKTWEYLQLLQREHKKKKTRLKKTKNELFGHQKTGDIWHRPRIQETVQHGGGGVMVCGRFAAVGAGQLTIHCRKKKSVGFTTALKTGRSTLKIQR